MRITVQGDGGRYVLPIRSQLLLFRPLTGEARLYWTDSDYKADANLDLGDRYVDLNGSNYSGVFQVPANVDSIWLRGEGAEIELTVIGQA